jgi:integrase/recombinase XerD
MPRKRHPRGTAPPRKKHKGIYQPPEQVVGGADPDSIWNHMQRFTRWMEEKNYSPHTIGASQRTIRAFAAWCAERGLIRPQEITKPILERWQRHLFLHRKPDGEPLTIRSQIAHTQPLRAFFKWLTRANHILYNPASELDLPRIGRRLPQHIMTQAEAERVLAIPNLQTPVGIRDRAILEVLYSTGIRRAELINLNVYDLDAQRGVLIVRQGKGNKDRVIPIGARALAWIDKYVEDVRPDLASGADDGTLFLTTHGGAFNAGWLAEIVRQTVVDSGINKRGSCHMFRHTMATLMLENGADIRFIQAMLGHADLSSTEIYTQVSIKALKAVHTATHPAKPIRAGGESEETAKGNTEGGLGEDEEAQPIRDRASRCAGGTARRADGEHRMDALLAVLDGEADEEG